jgi:hypothetical protein
LEFADHGPVLYLESRFAGLFVEQAEDIAQCRPILTELGDVALDVARTA